MRQADVDDGVKDGLTTRQTEMVRLRARTGASRWRTRSSGELPPTSPGTPSQNEVPAGPRTGRRGFPVRLPAGARLQSPGFYKCSSSVSQRDFEDATW